MRLSTAGPCRADISPRSGTLCCVTVPIGPGHARGREAAVSAQHGAAVCFLYGAPGIAQYRDACVIRPDVEAFGIKVCVEKDPAIAVDAAQVSIDTRDGRCHSSEIRRVLGSLARPTTEAQIETKVRDLAATGTQRRPVQPLIDALWHLEESSDVSEVMRLVR